MPLIDDRGRVFGKVNLVDALVVAFVLLVMPLAYSALLLFRLPVPQIASIEPSQLPEGAPITLRITGKDLRPFLRARVGVANAEFLVQSTSLAEVRQPTGLPAGSYDVSLFDEGQELV